MCSADLGRGRFVTKSNCPALLPLTGRGLCELLAQRNTTTHRPPLHTDCNRSMTLVCNLGAKGRLPRNFLDLESVHSDFAPQLEYFVFN